MKKLLLILIFAGILSMFLGWYYLSFSLPEDSVYKNSVITDLQMPEKQNNDSSANDLVAADTLSGCPDLSENVLSVDEHEFTVGMADNQSERERGLGGCLALADDQGLYFVLEEPTETSFWMKGMLIPIDIIWIFKGEVVGIDHDVQPPGSLNETNLTIYNSPQKVDAVLEIAAGRALEAGIEIGSKISF